MQGKRSSFDYLDRADSADDARLYSFTRESRIPHGYFDDRRRRARLAAATVAAVVLASTAVVVLLYIVSH
jgi:hypothetical protein